MKTFNDYCGRLTAFTAKFEMWSNDEFDEQRHDPDIKILSAVATNNIFLLPLALPYFFFWEKVGWELLTDCCHRNLLMKKPCCLIWMQGMFSLAILITFWISHSSLSEMLQINDLKIDVSCIPILRMRSGIHICLNMCFKYACMFINGISMHTACIPHI